MASGHPLRDSGIYRNLPTFGDDVRDLTAIVCGATGVSGFHAMRALVDNQRWTKIYSLSRRPMSDNLKQFLSEEQLSRIEHVSVDLTTSAETISEIFQSCGVRADYVFFYGYLQPKTDRGAMDPASGEELAKVNGNLLRNFLDALALSGIKPKRILLQTGGKNYGMHIGRVRTPLVESDPQPRHLATNFYYQQEDDLRAFCEAHRETGWNVIRPAAIIGSIESMAMNTFYSFAVYAAVQAAKGEPLKFGGDFHAWQFQAVHSTARLSGYLAEWAVLDPRCANQAFNAQDGSPLSWDRFFHELARWYAVSAGVERPTSDSSAYQEFTLAGGADAPLGYGPPLSVKYSFRLADWARDPAQRQGWQRLKDMHPNLAADPFHPDSPSDFLGDFAYLDFGSLSPSKARRFGFNGYVDSLESIFEQFEEMHAMGLLPPMRVREALPQI